MSILFDSTAFLISHNTLSQLCVEKKAYQNGITNIFTNVFPFLLLLSGNSTRIKLSNFQTLKVTML